MCYPVKALSILKRQLTSRRLQAPTTSHHLWQKQICSQQYRNYTSTSSATQPMCSVGRNNNNLPKNLGVHPNLPAKNSSHITAIHCHAIFKESRAGARS